MACFNFNSSSLGLSYFKFCKLLFKLSVFVCRVEKVGWNWNKNDEQMCDISIFIYVYVKLFNISLQWFLKFLQLKTILSWNEIERERER